MGAEVGALILAKYWAQSSMLASVTSSTIVSRISRIWVPLLPRRSRESIRSRVMVGLWIGWIGKEGGERIRGPSSSPPSHRHRWRGHSMQPRHQCCRCGVRSAPPSCSVGTSPKGSPKGRRTQHMPLRCCTGTHRCRSTGRRSRFRSLPNRSWSVVSFELRSV